MSKHKPKKGKKDNNDRLASIPEVAANDQPPAWLSKETAASLTGMAYSPRRSVEGTSWEDWLEHQA